MNKFNNRVLILGTYYNIVITNENDNPAMVGASGLTDNSIHTIFLDDCESFGEDSGLKDIDGYMRNVLRHGIIHAFLYESGLAASSCEVQAWAINEEMVDWFARQSLKIFKAFEEAGCNE